MRETLSHSEDTIELSGTYAIEQETRYERVKKKMRKQKNSLTWREENPSPFKLFQLSVDQSYYSNNIEK